MSKKAVQLDPNSSEAYCSLGHYYRPHFYSTSDSISQALAAFTKAIDLNPSNQDALLAMGLLKSKIGQYEDALSYLNIARELDPLKRSTLHAIGTVYYDKDDYDNAERYFTQARELEPEKEFLGFPWLDFSRGKCETAIRGLLKREKFFPEEQWFHHDLACVYKYCHKFDEAITEFEKCIELASNQKWHYLGLAAVYVEQERYDEAIAIYEKAMSKFPNCLFTRFEYSFVLKRRGASNKAKKILKNILRSPSIEYIDADRNIRQIAQFYIDGINESDMMMAINQAHERLNTIDQLTDLDYFVGMSYLLNLNHTYRNRDKAIKYLHKYHFQGNKLGVEYSLARTELQRLGALK